MLRAGWIVLFATACASTPPAPAPTSTLEQWGMDIDRLEQILRQAAPDLAGERGFWDLSIDGVPMKCIGDPHHDRMRIVAPIGRVSELSAGQLERAMAANYNTALDARYATSHGWVVAAFIHPLSPLTDVQVRSALIQVKNLALSFGTTYSSGILNFGQPETEI